MKKLLLVALMTVAGASVFAQGTVSMNTFGTGVDASAFLVQPMEGASFTYYYKNAAGVNVTQRLDNVTAYLPAGETPTTAPAVFNLQPGTKVRAALYAGSSAGNLAMIGNPGYFASAKAGFILSTSGGGNRNAAASAGDPAYVQVRAWTGNYASYEEFWTAANASGGVAPGFGYAGQSSVLLIDKTGGGPNPAAGMKGIDNIILYPVPEPSVIGLGLLGLAGLIFIRRRK